MEVKIDINRDSCIKCSKCVKICPSVIFMQNEDKSIGLENLDMCIGCGHCVSVCPTESISHELFPSETIHSFSYSDYPTAESLLMMMRARRSNRSISKNPIPQAHLDMIIEAAYRAPTASNMQGVGFTLITDVEKLKKVTEFTLNVFGSIIKKVDNPLLRPIVRRAMPSIYRYVPVFKKIRERFYNHNDDMILRNATALLVIHAPNKSRFVAEDTNLAYQNASLMAESLGLAQIYMGFVLTATKQNKGTLEKILNINGRIGAVMALGIPSVKYLKYVDRKPLKVSKFI